MILSGREIRRNLGNRIVIDPYRDHQLNPNSYNLRLHNVLRTYDRDPLDMKEENTSHEILIPEDGLLLAPAKLYLGRTIEYTETDGFVPMLEGRSSIGRLGLFVHVTAGFGDIGFKGFWTLEIFCVQPVRIYAGVEICQIFYHSIQGDYDSYSSGKYQNNEGIQHSLLFREFGKDPQLPLSPSSDAGSEGGSHSG
jgi:dCTP deaminase